MAVSAAERERAKLRPPGFGSIPACPDHDALRALIVALEAFELEADDQRAACWLATQRPWPDAGCRVGECLCGSSVMVRDLPPIVIEVA
jgi:hypothetical protein